MVIGRIAVTVAITRVPRENTPPSTSDLVKFYDDVILRISKPKTSHGYATWRHTQNFESKTSDEYATWRHTQNFQVKNVSWVYHKIMASCQKIWVKNVRWLCHMTSSENFEGVPRENTPFKLRWNVRKGVFSLGTILITFSENCGCIIIQPII